MVAVFSTISGNTILSGQGASSTGTGGGGIFTLTSPTPFTQLVMKGDGGDSGALLAICGNLNRRKLYRHY